MKELQEFERYLAHLGEGLGHGRPSAGAPPCQYDLLHLPLRDQ